MIKRIPGWLNYLILWLVYFGLGLFLRWVSGLEADTAYIALFTAFYCGAYLSKWAYNANNDNEWRFW